MDEQYNQGVPYVFLDLFVKAKKKEIVYKNV
jgi:hypothetical protein